ncbi:hypothetical protein ELI54_30365 (plasmid) [Rhizobium ruizarguesonis]|jgi:hypothetical protein|uniref:hypothetical protein n=1 Tax=Rhizobium ruizarguesonis TaxID=2081791 RepID=UPI001031462F|nr:hypothetical protein [Rhizobium ruizarguesonis]MBY5877419.1 hypothetical protein [Rhizobium leguminosarum]TBY63287.1 hypothetical protein E0H46_26095 [Rhizobium leguminosarum bv. viciae]TAT72206.1 hypothetical protein ELI56_31575 [Rhizobium ruizarguesonis]TAT75852.1 hypothetical protein ELI54_30365 [Rhizobium ruizarguesonis]TAT92065.1 hypothetical protein ELI53_35720 [Rhizobium ruizarguesonis]
MVGEDGQIYLLPFLSEEQALFATGETEENWPAIRRVSFRWVAVPGSPRGYHFFARFNADGLVVGVVFSGPYGMLPGEYPSLEAAAEAAWEDWVEHNPDAEYVPASSGYTG